MESKPPFSNVDRTASQPARGPEARSRPGPARRGERQTALHRLGWVLALLAGSLVVVISVLLAMQYFFSTAHDELSLGGDASQQALGAVFSSPNENFTIRPPKNWKPAPRTEGYSVIFKGPNEKGYPPLIMVCSELAPGRLESYVEEQKRRTLVANATVRWLQETPETFAGLEVMRLDYECEQARKDGEEPVTLRLRQYVLAASPRFYRITCCAAADVFERYVTRFEASVRSFERVAE